MSLFNLSIKEEISMLDFENLMLDDEVNTDDTAMESAALEGTVDYEDTELTPADESVYFLDTLMEECQSLEEFQAIVTENAVDFQLYGLIDDAEAAIEAVKRITIDDWKHVNFNRLVHRECVRLAKKNNDPNYSKYAMFREKMRGFRSKIFTRWEAKARTNVRKALQNSKSKASNINTSTGRKVTSQLTNAIKRAEAGHSPSSKSSTTNVKPNVPKRSK